MKLKKILLLSVSAMMMTQMAQAQQSERTRTYVWQQK